jgi:hypothetical protein
VTATRMVMPTSAPVSVYVAPLIAAIGTHA